MNKQTNKKLNIISAFWPQGKIFWSQRLYMTWKYHQEVGRLFHLQNTSNGRKWPGVRVAALATAPSSGLPWEWPPFSLGVPLRNCATAMLASSWHLSSTLYSHGNEARHYLDLAVLLWCHSPWIVRDPRTLHPAWSLAGGTSVCLSFLICKEVNGTWNLSHTDCREDQKRQ